MMFLETISLSRLHWPKMTIRSKPPLTQLWNNYWESVSFAKTFSVQMDKVKHLNTLRLSNKLRVTKNLELRFQGNAAGTRHKPRKLTVPLMNLTNATLHYRTQTFHSSLKTRWLERDTNPCITVWLRCTPPYHKLPLNFFHYFPANSTSRIVVLRNLFKSAFQLYN